MVDVSQKAFTARTASACGRIRMSRECYQAVESGTAKKGDVLARRRLRDHGRKADRRSDSPLPPPEPVKSLRLIPPASRASRCGSVCTVKCTGQTGVEMEALTGVNIALLTIYDMCKAIDKRMVMKDIHLVEKHGGKSGDFSFDGERKDGAAEASYV